MRIRKDKKYSFKLYECQSCFSITLFEYCHNCNAKTKLLPESSIEYSLRCEICGKYTANTIRYIAKINKNHYYRNSYNGLTHLKVCKTCRKTAKFLESLIKIRV